MTSASTYTYEVGYNPVMGVVTRARGRQKGVQKFLSTDPLTKGYPSLTPYQFASNTPIMAIDLDGLESSISIQFDSESHLPELRTSNGDLVIATVVQTSSSTIESSAPIMARKASDIVLAEVQSGQLLATNGKTYRALPSKQITAVYLNSGTEMYEVSVMKNKGNGTFTTKGVDQVSASLKRLEGKALNKVTAFRAISEFARHAGVLLDAAGIFGEYATGGNPIDGVPGLGLAGSQMLDELEEQQFGVLQKQVSSAVNEGLSSTRDLLSTNAYAGANFELVEVAVPAVKSLLAGEITSGDDLFAKSSKNPSAPTATLLIQKSDNDNLDVRAIFVNPDTKGKN